MDLLPENQWHPTGKHPENKACEVVTFEMLKQRKYLLSSERR
jgi:hypothetical protein